jgi:hypothetical protein
VVATARVGAFTADDMLRYAEVPGFPNVYVVGCLEPQVSIFSQQVRALNLVWALASTERLGRRAGSLAIVGAGFAGATAAVAAAWLQWKAFAQTRNSIGARLESEHVDRFLIVGASPEERPLILQEWARRNGYPSLAHEPDPHLEGLAVAERDGQLFPVLTIADESVQRCPSEPPQLSDETGPWIARAPVESGSD